MVEGRAAVASGNWRIENSIDRITAAPVSSALVGTRSVANSLIPFPQPALLQLICFKGAPIVRFSFQFKVGSTRNAELGYAFDKNPGREPKVRFVEGWRNVVIEDGGEVARFVQDLSAASDLYIRIRSLNAGRTSAEFAVAGAAEAIRQAYAQCPLTPPKAADAKTSGAKAPTRRRPAASRQTRRGRRRRGKSASSGSGDGYISEEEAALRQIQGWFGH